MTTIFGEKMHYPDMKNAAQSLKKGKHRTKIAVDAVGKDVMLKIWAFTLYSLGYSYEYIAGLCRFSEAGVKRIVNEVLRNGVHGFLDKRKKIKDTQIIRKIQKTSEIKTSIENNDESVSRKLDEKLMELHSLFELSQTLNSSLNVTAILDNLLLTPMGKMMISKGIVLLNQSQENYKVETLKGLPQKLIGEKVKIHFSFSTAL